MRRLVTVAACALVLAGCGGSSGPESAGPQSQPPAGEATAEASAGASTTAPAGRPEPPEFFLTGARTGPAADVREITAVCGDAGGAGQWLFDFEVPADWVENGKGNSGGGMTGTNGYGDIDHTLPDGTKMRIKVKQDDRSHTGELLDADQNPVAEDNFDYSFERGIGDAPVETIQVTYETLDPVVIDGQSAPFARVEQEASGPDASEFVARLHYATVPASRDSGERHDWTATVTLSWDSERGSVDDATARSVLESFRFGQCAQDSALNYLELMGISTEE